MLLIRGNQAHIWNEDLEDTVCQSYSQFRQEEWEFYEGDWPYGVRLCKNCKNPKRAQYFAKRRKQ